MNEFILERKGNALPKIVVDTINASFFSKRKRVNKVGFRIKTLLLSIIKQGIDDANENGFRVNLTRYIDASVFDCKVAISDTEIERYRVGLLVEIADQLNEAMKFTNSIIKNRAENEWVQLQLLESILKINTQLEEEASIFEDVADEPELEIGAGTDRRKRCVVADEDAQTDDEADQQTSRVDVKLSDESHHKMSLYRFDAEGNELLSQTNFLIQAATRGYVRLIDPTIENVKLYYLRRTNSNINQMTNLVHRAIEGNSIDPALATILTTELDKLYISLQALAGPAKLRVVA
jgi:hypothetical protein